jgi:hypothetical protein
MTDQPSGRFPGHLDIDSVSAFIDRDLHPDDVSEAELHIAFCPACQREVLEIHATVLLLAGLPQYTPRRSFCLTGEHARFAGRSTRSRAAPWSNQIDPTGYALPSAPMAAGRYAGIIPGLHAAALVIGALLILMTSSDFLGIPPQPAAMLGDEDAAPPTVMVSAPEPATSFQGSAARVAPAPRPAITVTATAFASEAAFATISQEAGGTTGSVRTSEDLETTADDAPAASSISSTSIAEAVVQAQPTAAASLGQGMAGKPEESAGAATARTQQDGAGSSRLRLAEIALALALAWIIVTIAGLRWLQRLR